MNNLKLITTHKDYLLLVDFNKEDLSDGGYCHAADTSLFTGAPFINMSLIEKQGAYKEVGMRFYTIIAHLPLNNAPVLEGLPLLPELSDIETEVSRAYHDKYPPLLDTEQGKMYFRDGYLASQRRWTDEHIKEAIEIGMRSGKTGKSLEECKDYFYSVFSSTKLPTGFEPEMESETIEQARGRLRKDGDFVIRQQFKIINNVIQGRYIYE